MADLSKLQKRVRALVRGLVHEGEPPSTPDLAEQTYLRNPQAITESSGSELLLVDVGRGGTFKLNETGRMIWSRVIEGLTPREIAREVAATYGVADDRALADTLALIADLEAAALIARRERTG